MSAPLHERLAEAARAATPGGWNVKLVTYQKGINLPRTVGWVQGLGGIVEVSPEDARHIAGADPEAVMRLCEQVRSMKEAMSDSGLANELWAAAQLAPGEGIEDAINRIALILKRTGERDE